MKKLSFIVVMLLFTFSGFSQNETQSKTVSSNTQFALKLYKQLADYRGDIFISPYSISSAMVMTYAGARGETEKQMQEVMGFGAQETVHSDFCNLNKQLYNSRSENVKLSIANNVWVQKDLWLKNEFVQLTDSFYGANVKVADFKNDIVGACKDINEWVEQETEKMIKELLKPTQLTPTTRLVLVNAIYFKAEWKTKFDQSRTSKMKFVIDAINTQETDFMFQTSQNPYYQTDELQALSLAYNDNFSMVILLPTDKLGLSAFEQSLTEEKLNNILSGLQLSRTDIEVAIPKFEIKYSAELAEKLKNLGLTAPFGDFADFSGLTDKEELMIDEVIHQAVIKVSEEGTEAAGATAVVIREKSISIPIKFVADHPFMFLIRENSTGSILFLGRYAGPAIRNRG